MSSGESDDVRAAFEAALRWVNSVVALARPILEVARVSWPHLPEVTSAVG